MNPNCGINVSVDAELTLPCTLPREHTGDHVHTTEVIVENEYEAEQLVGAAEWLKSEIEHLEARYAAKKARLADLLGTGTHEVAGRKVIITLPLRWTTEGKKHFAKHFPPGSFPHLYKQPELNTRAIDAQDPALDTDGCKALGDPVVRIIGA